MTPPSTILLWDLFIFTLFQLSLLFLFIGYVLQKFSILNFFIHRPLIKLVLYFIVDTRYIQATYKKLLEVLLLLNQTYNYIYIECKILEKDYFLWIFFLMGICMEKFFESIAILYCEQIFSTYIDPFGRNRIQIILTGHFSYLLPHIRMDRIFIDVVFFYSTWYYWRNFIIIAYTCWTAAFIQLSPVLRVTFICGL